MTYASDLPDFQDLLRATADDLNLPLWIVEKDYYVTRALRALQDNVGDQFLFKGGTSLSKGWNLIERFSEDIDLLFRTEQDGEELGKKNRHKRFKDAEAIVAATPGFTLVQPDKPLSSETGMHRESLFSYPFAQAPTGAVSDKIRLEMNCRGGTHPHETRSIRSYITAFLERSSQTNLANDLSAFNVECLGVTRTFVEKLFAVHAAFTLDRAVGRTRHYYDLYHLAGLAEVQAFIVSDEFGPIFIDVQAFSVEHWPDKALPPGMNFAQYDVLRPSDAHLAELTRNYTAERDLFFRPPPSMTEILSRLQNLPFPA
jgi:predicted nucleotidyltransferase component of viral defense system